MRRLRLTITLKDSLINEIDKLVDGQKIRNRSHGIEYILSQYFKPAITKAVILAGGRGEKLRPYTYELPKSMLPVKGRPLLQYLIEDLRNADIHEIIICVGYLGDKIKKYFDDGARFGVKIIYSDEKTPLGTGGAIKKIRALIKNESFLVLYGDILINLNLKDVINFHNDYEVTATVALTSANNPSPFGQFELHGNKIVGFYEKIKKEETKSHLVNTGVYVFKNTIFRCFPDTPKDFMLETILQDLIKNNELNGFVFEGKWFDVGTPDNYELAIKQFKKISFNSRKNTVR